MITKFALFEGGDFIVELLCVESNFPLEQPQSKFKFVVGHFYRATITKVTPDMPFVREMKDENGSNVSNRFIEFDSNAFYIKYDDPLHGKLFQAILTMDSSVEDYLKRKRERQFDL